MDDRAEADETTQWVLAARTGDERAQRRLIAAYQERIASFVFATVTRSAEVDDLTQVVLLRMLDGLAGLREPQRFEAWLFRLARNICIDHLRRRRWERLFSPLEPVHEDTIPAAAGTSPELLDALRHALEQLSASDRAVLALAANGLSYDEMAEALGKSMTATKVMLHRARERLKKHYKTPDHA